MPARLTGIAGLMGMLTLSMWLTGCSASLEELVEQRHQARIEAANANLPVARGATDGTGAYIKDTPPRLTVEASEPRDDKNP
jgi:hypothetical protein